MDVALVDNSISLIMKRLSVVILVLISQSAFSQSTYMTVLPDSIISAVVQELNDSTVLRHFRLKDETVDYSSALVYIGNGGLPSLRLSSDSTAIATLGRDVCTYLDSLSGIELNEEGKLDLGHVNARSLHIAIGKENSLQHKPIIVADYLGYGVVQVVVFPQYYSPGGKYSMVFHLNEIGKLEILQFATIKY